MPRLFAACAAFGIQRLSHKETQQPVQNQKNNNRANDSAAQFPRSESGKSATQ
jgi:hypothetical protein